MARRDHRDLVFTVGSLTDLPYPDDQFAGVMLWYSIIHTPAASSKGPADTSWLTGWTSPEPAGASTEPKPS